MGLSGAMFSEGLIGKRIQTTRQRIRLNLTIPQPRPQLGNLHIAEPSDCGFDLFNGVHGADDTGIGGIRKPEISAANVRSQTGRIVGLVCTDLFDSISLNWGDEQRPKGGKVRSLT